MCGQLIMYGQRPNWRKKQFWNADSKRSALDVTRICPRHGCSSYSSYHSPKCWQLNYTHFHTMNSSVRQAMFIFTPWTVNNLTSQVHGHKYLRRRESSKEAGGNKRLAINPWEITVAGRASQRWGWRRWWCTRAVWERTKGQRSELECGN